MNMKSFAMLAMSGLLVTSFAYIAPAMADDAGNNGQSMQQPTPSDNGMQDQNGGSQNGSSANQGSDNTMNNDSGSSNSVDQGSPDTATGDDDY